MKMSSVIGSNLHRIMNYLMDMNKDAKNGHELDLAATAKKLLK